MNKIRSYLKNKRLIIGLYLAPAIAAFSIALVMLPGIRPQAIDSVANSTADVVIGQPDMNSNLINQVGYGKTLNYPNAVASFGTKLFVADMVNSRVLIYNTIPASNNAPADVVVGQPDFTSNSWNQGGGAKANTLAYPCEVSTDGARLFVGDLGNNRVLIYNTIPTSNNASADVVIGQLDFKSSSANQGGSVNANTLSSPVAANSDGTRLFVADYDNQRVLIYNTIPTSNNASADVVIGQLDFKSNLPNRGGSGVRAWTLAYPSDVNGDGTRLFMADQANHRVLIYNTIPTTNGASANVVIGQPDMNSSMDNQGGSPEAYTLYMPSTVSCDGTRLFVGDLFNQRVLIYNNINTLPATNASADVVIGQPNFTSNSGNQGGIVRANTVSGPISSLSNDGKKLFIGDRDNNRVLIYNTIPTSSNAPADTVIGQPDMTSNSVNQTTTSIKANTLNNPGGSFSDGTRLFVADYYNNRILIFNSIPTSSNANADVVVGQQDMTHNLINQNNGTMTPEANTLWYPSEVFSDGTRLIISDNANYRVLIFNAIPAANNASADVVIGQPDMRSRSPNQGGIPSARAHSQCGGLCYDGNRLFITDPDNNRVLIYNSLPSANNAPADIVVGQPDMSSSTANNGGLSSRSLSYPGGVFSDGEKLYIADRDNHRILIYNSIPTSNNAAADTVIGQLDMSSNSSNQGAGVAANTLSSPRRVSVNGNRLFITDLWNNRVLVYSTIPSSNNASADIVIGQPDMTSNMANNGGVSSKSLYAPISVSVNDSKVFITDIYNHRVLIYNLTTTKPVISDVKFDGSGYVSGDTIRTAPVIAAKMTDTGGVGGIYINNLKITVDTTLYTYASFDATTDSYNSTTGVFTFKVKNTLATGTHNVKIEISDYLGNWGTYEANNLNVNDSSGTVQMDGIPLNYPNPFKPLSETTKLTYKLTVDSDILIYIFDVRGVLLKKASYSSGSMGGKAGYNEITWDGKDDFGSTVGNGIYPYRVVSGGRILGRGKIAVLD